MLGGEFASFLLNSGEGIEGLGIWGLEGLGGRVGMSISTVGKIGMEYMLKCWGDFPAAF